MLSYRHKSVEGGKFVGLVVEKANTFKLVMHTQHIFIVGHGGDTIRHKINGVESLNKIN